MAKETPDVFLGAMRMPEMPESWVESKPEYILCAAIHFDDGLKYEHQPKNISQGFVVTGRRHHNCLLTVFILSKKDWRRDSLAQGMVQTQGFLTSKDRFLGRTESYHLAVKSGQIKDDSEIKSLHSEDVW
jgi:hypothetical protein